MDRPQQPRTASQALVDALMGLPSRVGNAFTNMATQGLQANERFMSGDGANQPFLPSMDSGGRLGELASFITSNMAMGGPAGSLGAGPSMARKASALPMDEASRMARANEMFPVEAYHATRRDFPAFENAKIGSNLDTGYYGTGHYFAPTPSKTNQYIIGNYKTGASGEVIPEFFMGSQVIPARLAMKNPLVIDKAARRADTVAEVERLTGFKSTDWPLPEAERAPFMDALKKAGFDGVQVNVSGKPAEYVVPNAEQVRSRFAAFDPAKRNSADLLASYGPNPLAAALYAQPQE
jgi:hypothetical protein